MVRATMRPAGRGRRGTLVHQLRRAVKDRYVRKGLKAVRPWPRQKNDHPPGLPKMREASPAEKRHATRTDEKTKRA